LHRDDFDIAAGKILIGTAAMLLKVWRPDHPRVGRALIRGILGRLKW
jgi:hypothetical protein